MSHIEGYHKLCYICIIKYNIMERIIRKISVGLDINNQLHISSGSIMAGNTISSILEKEDNEYEVWVELKDDDGICVWKTIKNMPVVVEYDTRLA